MKTKGIFKAIFLFWGLEYLFFDAFPWYDISLSNQSMIIIGALLTGILIILVRRPRRS